MTLQGFGYEEILRMPESKRGWWAKRSAKHQKEVKEALEKSGKRGNNRKRR